MAAYNERFHASGGYIYRKNNQVIRLRKSLIRCYLGCFVKKSGKNQVCLKSRLYKKSAPRLRGFAIRALIQRADFLVSVA